MIKYKIFGFIICFLSFLSLNSQTVEKEKFIEYFSEAQRFLLTENTDTAKYLLIKALEIDNQSSAANYLLSKIYEQEAQYFLAINYAENAVNIDAENIWYLKNLALLYEKVNSINEATDLQLQIIQKSDIHDDFQNAIDFFAFYSDYKNQLIALNAAISKFNYEIDFYLQKVNLLQKTGKNDDAVNLLQTIVQKFPQNSLSLVNLAQFYLSEKNLDSAFFYIKKIQTLFPETVYFYELSLKYYILIDKKDSVLYYLEKSGDCLSSNSAFIQILYENMDFFNYNSFSFDLDTIFYNLYFKNQSNVRFVNFLSEFYEINNKFYDAIYFYEIKQSKDITDFSTYLKLFNLYNRFGFYSKLDSLAAYAIDLFPAQPVIYLFKGISSLNLSKNNDAYEALIFGKSIVYEQNDLMAYFNFYLSQYFRITGNFSDENLYYNNALSFATSNCDLNAYFSFYFAQNSLYKNKTFNLLGECIINETSSLSSNIAYIYAYAMYKFDDYNSSLNYCQIAISNSSKPNFLYYELLGNVYNKLNKNDLANEAWLKSVNLGNTFLNKQL